MVCVEGILAILESGELSVDGNKLGGQIQRTAEILEGKVRSMRLLTRPL